MDFLESGIHSAIMRDESEKLQYVLTDIN